MGPWMADRKMGMTTENHGRRHSISYIHECMGEKGLTKNPPKFSWPQNQYLCQRCSVSSPTNCHAVTHLKMFTNSLWNSMVRYLQTYLIINQYHHHIPLHELHSQGDNWHQAPSQQLASEGHGNISLTPRRKRGGLPKRNLIFLNL